MKISLESSSSGYIIHGYAHGEIRVRAPGASDDNVEVFRRSLVISPQRIIGDWEPQSFDELAGGHFGVLSELRPEVILLGSGSRMRLPSPPLLSSLVRLGVGYEVMDTGAACRTYNILASEGRRVAAALLIG